MAFTYPYTYGEESADADLRNKLKKWGILKDDMHDPLAFLDVLLTVSKLPSMKRTINVYHELIDLKKRVKELEKRVGGKIERTKVDYVYEFFREDLEKEHFGKIVAIDTDSEKIVGIGNTLLEAFNTAKENTGKEQFDFRRVGYKYLYTV